MHIWIDLANSPHVPFFSTLIPEFESRGHSVEVTVRDFAETMSLTQAAGLRAAMIGSHGGRYLSGKTGNLLSRARTLRGWARPRKFDLALSHNSYSQIVAARSLGLRTITLMDYEYQPANHLAFRLAHRVIVPQAFPETSLRRFGASSRKVQRYHGIKEDVYLSDFAPDENFSTKLTELGISTNDVLVIVRPPAEEALYHRFENELFEGLLETLAQQAVKVLLLPRNTAQRTRYQQRAANFVTPIEPLHGANLVAASDLVISAGGTMNREAAALGVPATSIYAGRWAAIDEELSRTGRLNRVNTLSDLEGLTFKKKATGNPRADRRVRDEVIDCILR
jgi:predicted glycosyltransferase